MCIQRNLRILLSALILSLALAAWFAPAASAVEAIKSFRPVDPAELKMTSDPDAPGAPAIILYRELYRDDNGATGREDDYYRVKVLTEEGRKQADVQIIYVKGKSSVTGIHARTIKPDGTIVDFDGKVFSKSLTKGRGAKYDARIFTLPDVQVGSIIEYYFTLELGDHTIFDSLWEVGDNLFIKAGDFSLKPYENDSYNNFSLTWTWENLPPGTPEITQGGDRIVRLHVSNVPAFVTEDFMPPEEELKGRVDFKYSSKSVQHEAAPFWADVGKRLNGEMEGFIGKPKNLAGAVSEIVGAGDPPEVKLQKIYARVQQLRNTSYEVHKSEEEAKRANEKEPSSAEEAWKKGYADGTNITWLYLGLVRAAGLEAYGLMVADRSDYFFNPAVMNDRRLNSNVVLVKLNGKNIFCDPGAAYTPYGLLPWSETGVQGLQLDKKDSSWITTMVSTPEQAATERHADLTLSDTGDLEGKLTVTYTGMEAADIRRYERNADATDRKKYLEDKVKEYSSATCEVSLTNQPEWKNSAVPLVAEFNFKVPGYAAQAGHHVMVPVALFGAPEKHLFDHADRVHPIYFEYPFMESDDINIQLPAGWKISSLPPGWNDSGKVVTYNFAAQDAAGKLHLSRAVAVNFTLMDKKYYAALRNYFQRIKNTDDQTVVVDPAAATAGNLSACDSENWD